tara:strand:+ start:2082 stop:2420 length:339 start_codon:yes stop_codon:yes gene_type:complete
MEYKEIAKAIKNLEKREAELQEQRALLLNVVRNALELVGMHTGNGAPGNHWPKWYDPQGDQPAWGQDGYFERLRTDMEIVLVQTASKYAVKAIGGQTRVEIAEIMAGVVEAK